MKDATDVFYSLHSDKAIKQLKKHFRYVFVTSTLQPRLALCDVS